ncbi:cytochrome P450 [Thamnocephalis sphaerospora]|uniref:Cytochrome P450 n=1 Tax=Thamnocephalis sphaerospora TaxID=78915 RepID=A0A4P9XJU5_9FUNG|nr:cytochrome P450 [Thamnocephalis sphaerospora]|eukprot:RKP06012.1 cytochrome P450 [Thamnocephalis sphaerospora]
MAEATLLWLDNLVSVVFTKEFILAVAVAWMVGGVLYHEYLSPLAKIPGPRPVVLSEYILLSTVYRQHFDEYIRSMHAKYGPVVRLAPKLVSIADPDAMSTFYNTPRFPKSALYAAFHNPTENIFSTQNIELHKKLRRLIAPSFSMSAVLAIEPLIVDAGTDKLSKRIAMHAERGDTFDLMAFLHHMTFDVIGAVSFGQSFGLQTGGDRAIINWIEDLLAMGILKLGLRRLFHPRFFPQLTGSTEKLVNFTRKVIYARRISGAKHNDILQRFIEAVDEETGDGLSEDQLIAESIIQLIAGTDTTAVTLTWTMHLLLENPNCMQRLYEELKDAIPDPDTEIHYADVKSLPYLDGVLHESLRMRPVSAAGSGRTVPEGGAYIAGHFIPEGTEISTSIITIHGLESIFPNADLFKPERWLGANEQVSEMKRSLLTFAMGPRGCVGRNLAWFELRLTLATLVRQFAFDVPSGMKVDMTPAQRFISKPKDGKLLVRAAKRAV